MIENLDKREYPIQSPPPKPGEGKGKPPDSLELSQVHGECPPYIPTIDLITKVHIEDETQADKTILSILSNQPEILTNAALNEEDVVAMKRKNEILIVAAAAGAGLAAIALGIGAKKIYDHKKAMVETEKETKESRSRKLFTKFKNFLGNKKK